jgi:hypothetical protein
MSQLVPAQTVNKTSLNNFTIGREFEEYIISLFNERHFKLKKYRKSEDFNGKYIDDASHPDLEMELVFTVARKYRFAVECKWRREFKTSGYIEWANDAQICKYRIFQDQTRIPVFIAIGIGGTAKNPEKLFVTPLNNICERNHVHESELILYNRKPTNKFFYDIKQGMLF